jgi:hypothetical protein
MNFAARHIVLAILNVAAAGLLSAAIVLWIAVMPEPSGLLIFLGFVNGIMAGANAVMAAINLRGAWRAAH